MVSRQLEHVVLLKLRPMSTLEWQTLHTKFTELCKIIPGIEDFSFGPNFKYQEGTHSLLYLYVLFLSNSFLGGFNYGLRVKFNGDEALQTYQDHPLHIKFKDLLNPLEKHSADWYLT